MAVTFDFSRLKPLLLHTNLRKDNNALYQLLEQLLTFLKTLVTTVNSGLALTGSQLFPSDPSGTTSTVGKMMGLNATLTPGPNETPSALVIICGDVGNSITPAGAKITLRYGTGTAPSNGDASTGTNMSSQIEMTSLGAAERVPFSVQGIVSSLQSNTTYWFDILLKATTGGTVTIKNVGISIVR